MIFHSFLYVYQRVYTMIGWLADVIHNFYYGKIGWMGVYHSIPKSPITHPCIYYDVMLALNDIYINIQYRLYIQYLWVCIVKLLFDPTTFPLLTVFKCPYIPCSSSIHSLWVFLKMRDPEVSFSHGLIRTWMIRN